MKTNNTKKDTKTGIDGYYENNHNDKLKTN